MAMSARCRRNAMPLPKEAQTSPNTPQTKMFWFLGFSLGMESFAQSMSARYRRNTTPLLEAQTSPNVWSSLRAVGGRFTPCSQLRHWSEPPSASLTVVRRAGCRRPPVSTVRGQMMQCSPNPPRTKVYILGLPCVVRLPVGDLARAPDVAGARCPPFDPVHRPWPPSAVRYGPVWR